MPCSQRGDGFPLANMLSLVSVEQKELAPVMAAHIYTVCPTAIPRLPCPSPDASEEELMESLGMEKKSDGNFETFERFLSRTEVSGRHERKIYWHNDFTETVVNLNRV